MRPGHGPARSWWRRAACWPSAWSARGGAQGHAEGAGRRGRAHHARRLVAERCLYGVDKNVFAVDPPNCHCGWPRWRRSIPSPSGHTRCGTATRWLACRASRLRGFNWEADKQLPLLRSLRERARPAGPRLREQIQGMGGSDDVPEKARLLKEANEALDDVRRIADPAVTAFFAHDKPRDRGALRVVGMAQVERWLVNPERPIDITEPGRPGDLPLGTGVPRSLHCENPGFDAFVGNPPFWRAKCDGPVWRTVQRMALRDSR